MLYLVVYLFDVYEHLLSKLGQLAFSLCILTLLGAMLIVFNFEYKDYDGSSQDRQQGRYIYETAVKWVRRFVITILSITVFTSLAPTKQGLMMMGGVYVGKQVYDKVEQSELTEKAVKILNLELDNYLDKYIEEAQAKKESKGK